MAEQQDEVHDVSRFEGKVVLVTGAASGIGKATATRFATEGASVACLDVNVIGAEATCISIHGGGGQARWYRCDVTDASEVERVVATVVDELGPPNVCCNVAGIGRFARSEEQPVEEFRTIIEVNLVGTFAMSRACLPHLLGNGGCIVNVSSSPGTMGQPYSAAYCSSKGGVTMLTKAMAVEFNRRGVRVNAVAPAGIDTPLTKEFGFVEGTDPQEYLKMFPPTGKMAAPEEVAALIAFLASDEAGYLSGAVVPIDMGVTA